MFRYLARGGPAACSLRRTAILILALLCVPLAFAEAASTGECQEEELPSVNDRLYLDWAFAEEAPFDRVFKRSEKRKETLLLALDVGSALSDHLDAGFVFQHLAPAGLALFWTWLPVEASPEALRATLRERVWTKRPTVADPSFFVFLEDGTGKLGGVPTEELIRGLRETFVVETTSIDDLSIGDACTIERERDGHRVRRTIVRVVEGAERRGTAACLMSAILAHYGLSDTEAMFHSEALLHDRPNRDGKHMPPIKYCPLCPLYAWRAEGPQPVPLREGMTKCEAFDVLRQRWGEED